MGSACGDPGGVEVTFDGVRCAYTGRAAVAINEPIRIQFENRSGETTSLVVFHVGPEATLDDLLAAAQRDRATAILGGGFMDVPSLRRIEVGAGGSGKLDRRLEPGTWLVGCVTAPSGSDRLHPATLLVVDDS